MLTPRPAERRGEELDLPLMMNKIGEQALKPRAAED
jgi:hypothetical protein